MTGTKYDERQARQIGERWKVEWCSECPRDKSGDCIIDQATYTHEFFIDRAEAEDRLREVEKLGLDFFGCPRMYFQAFGVEFYDEDGWPYHSWEDEDIYEIADGEIYKT